MAGEYGIQYFHAAGSWVPFGTYQHMTLEKAMAEAESCAENRYAYPLGVRVTGPKGWKSSHMGGRYEIELSYDPIVEIWTVGCSECKSTEDHTDVYQATKFARTHECQERTTQ